MINTRAVATNPITSSSVEENVSRACARIAPCWPLDRFIAVNPFWGMIDTPLPEVAAKLSALSGAQLLMPRAWYRQEYREGRLRDQHLAAALARTASGCSLDELRALLERAEPSSSPPRSRVVDVVDAGRDLVHEVSWRSFVTHSVSQFCAAHFDEGQASVGPDREGGLYASWRRRAPSDRSPAALMGFRDFRRLASELPSTARALTTAALEALEISEPEQEHYLWSLLLDQNGWASWCAYRRWTSRLAGSDDTAISDLLAIRLAWEWVLLRAGGEQVTQRWKLAMASGPMIDASVATARSDDWLLQSALEIAWREPVLDALPAGFRAVRPASPSVQAVFCIDVRSEVFRRALEATSPSVQTLGFAGFFGIPMDYRSLGAPAARPQLPGLLAPRLRASDTGLEANAEERRAQRLDLGAVWSALRTDALSTFTFVEALGLTYAGKLAVDSLGLGGGVRVESAGLSRDADARRKPRLVGSIDGGVLDTDARCDLAATILRAMSLTRNFARIVLLAGHGSTTRNNPHAAGLDCGACCGQTGEVNARAAAALLNEPEVRVGLSRRGITVPERTWFVAGLHNTTTDDIALLDLDELPASHCEDLATLRQWLLDAGARTRTERAKLLGLEELAPSRLHQAVRARTTDWAQVRAEWGLANNAAFIIAPRERCKHLDLRGRSFLHEYRHEEDADNEVLELIMTAPMIVTHWINFQYYASTVDNARYGSGNKVLHNVVGGHLGVFEGNGGDLRIGLPMQSVHDGERFVHTPLRLSVFIEAPRPAIDAVLRKHTTVRALAGNGWLELFQLDAEDEAIYAHRDGRWHIAS